MPQEETKDLAKSYLYLFLILGFLVLLYIVTQNPTLNPSEPPESKHDVVVHYSLSGEIWENDLHLVDMPYDCRYLYENTSRGMNVKHGDVVTTVDTGNSDFTVEDIGDGGEYRLCTYTDYGGIVESDKFGIERTNESATLLDYSGDRLEGELLMKEYYKGELRQQRDLRVDLSYASLEPI